MFKIRSKSLNISERDPIYKVKYLGNVLTAFMRGDGCVDRPASILWNNYLGNQESAIDMQLTVCVSGLKARTKDLGLTEYRAHRISYCVCHPHYPRLFIWVYRHEGKKMKVELRCHAVLCKNDAVAKAIAVQLHDKLSFALSEFTREKTRRQRARLSLQRANSLPNGAPGPLNPTPVVPPMRTKFLTVGQNFKPPSDKSIGAPKLGAISEDLEEEVAGAEATNMNRHEQKRFHLRLSTTTATGKHELDRIGNQSQHDNVFSSDQKQDFEQQDESANHKSANHLSKVKDVSSCSSSSADDNSASDECRNKSSRVINGEVPEGILDLEIGNDIQLLKNDVDVQVELVQVDSDSDGSVESGFSE